MQPILWHRVGSTVGGGDVDGKRVPGSFDHLQHLQLRVQLQPVAALALHQGAARSLHPNQPAAQRGEELGGRGGSGVLHREVDPSSGSVHVHVGGPRQLQGGGEAQQTFS